MDIECFVQLLVKHVTREQIDALLEEITAAEDGGHCPICCEDDIPVDKDGNEIEGDDMEDTFEWREKHTDKCPVTYLEIYRLTV
jgi:hypothetical protein